MDEKKLKVLTDEKGKYQFNSNAMKALINKKKAQKKELGIKMGTYEILGDISNLLSVSLDTAKSWVYGVNSPGDMTLVQGLADYFGVDVEKLLTVLEDNNMNKTINMPGVSNIRSVCSFEREAINDIYRSMKETVKLTKCFYMAFEYAIGDQSSETYEELAKQMYKQTCNKVKENLINISVDIYESIEEYLWSTLYKYVYYTEGDNDFCVYLDDRASKLEEKEVKRLVEAGMSEEEARKNTVEDAYLDYCDNAFFSDMRELFKDFIPA